MSSYLRRRGIRCPDAQKRVSVGGCDSTGLQGSGLDGVAVHKEGGGLALNAEGHLVPARVHQSLHGLPRENAAHRVSGGVGGHGPQGQGSVGAAEVHRQLDGRGCEEGHRH